jgi:two-component system chemotaxis response regulator CheY
MAKEQYHALIVDDVPSNREIVRAMLRKLGCAKVASASNGKEALAWLKEAQFQLVVCDWEMPEVDGFKVFISAKNMLSPMPVFMMITGENDSARVKQAVAAGVDGYIVKPVNFDNFKAQVARAIRHKKESS